MHAAAYVQRVRGRLLRVIQIHEFTVGKPPVHCKRLRAHARVRRCAPTHLGRPSAHPRAASHTCTVVPCAGARDISATFPEYRLSRAPMQMPRQPVDRAVNPRSITPPTVHSRTHHGAGNHRIGNSRRRAAVNEYCSQQQTGSRDFLESKKKKNPYTRACVCVCLFVCMCVCVCVCACMRACGSRGGRGRSSQY
jgi:hypothetical protein